jgi:hypothetical protein
MLYELYVYWNIRNVIIISVSSVKTIYMYLYVQFYFFNNWYMCLYVQFFFFIYHYKILCFIVTLANYWVPIKQLM